MADDTNIDDMSATDAETGAIADANGAAAVEATHVTETDTEHAVPAVDPEEHDIHEESTLKTLTSITTTRMAPT